MSSLLRQSAVILHRLDASFIPPSLSVPRMNRRGTLMTSSSNFLFDSLDDFEFGLPDEFSSLSLLLSLELPSLSLLALSRSRYVTEIITISKFFLSVVVDLKIELKLKQSAAIAVRTFSFSGHQALAAYRSGRILSCTSMATKMTQINAVVYAICEENEREGEGRGGGGGGGVS